MHEAVRQALELKRAIYENYLDVRYIRFADDSKPFKRGTVVIDDTIIPPYPKIGRLFVLKEGLNRYFKEPFYIEEKADGYNIRVIYIKDRILAITRGGFVCPFSTDRLPDFYDFEKFFRENPHLILFGEIIGPNNPYMELHPPYITFDVAFKLFDIYNPIEKRFFLPEERYRIADLYQIPQVGRFGRFNSSDFESIKEIVLKLNEEEIEGVVIKSAEKVFKYFKYATPIINIKDIEADIDLLLELPGEFYTQRILRYALSSLELGFDDQEVIEKLGKILIENFKKVVQEFKSTAKISRQYVLYFNKQENIEEFIKLESRASDLIKVKLIEIEKSSDKFKVTIEKTFLKATTRLYRLLRGYPLYD
ncbi:MAG: RNA ligase [bacterium]|nr:RNA ligase [bacterium]